MTKRRGHPPRIPDNEDETPLPSTTTERSATSLKEVKPRRRATTTERSATSSKEVKPSRRARRSGVLSKRYGPRTIPFKWKVRRPNSRPTKRGTQALREIRHYQKSSGLLIPRRRFENLVQEICAEHYNIGKTGNRSEQGLRFTRDAMASLQFFSEAMIQKFLSLS
jgi:histone H3/H4